MKARFRPPGDQRGFEPTRKRRSPLPSRLARKIVCRLLTTRV
jgi:hypothetical protein